MSGSRAWTVKREGRIRVHHSSCAHWAVDVHGRNAWQTIDEVLQLMRDDQISYDQVCGTCGSRLRAAYDAGRPSIGPLTRSTPPGVPPLPW